MTGRWLALVIVPAIVLLYGLSDSLLPSDLHWWLALVAGAFSTLGVVGGVLIRRVVKPS